MRTLPVVSMPAACAALLLLVACASPEPPSDPIVESTEADLMEADRAFAERARESGLDGWMEYFAEDAARLPRLGLPAVRGLDGIRRTDAPLFADPNVRLTWTPADAGLFADGIHGYTTGWYELLERQPDGSEQVVAGGAYISWWRREADGEWRVILDTGVPDPPAAPSAAP